MVVSVVADRFVRESDGWLDLATGETRSVPADDFVENPLTPGLASMLERVVGVATREVGRGFRVVGVPDSTGGPGQLRIALARRLVPLGFVVVDAGLDISAPVARELARRQVVLVYGRETRRASALRWVRRQAQTSGCVHLLVVHGDPGKAQATPATREGALDLTPAYRPGLSRTRPDRCWRRAQTAGRRGRHASAERWLRAALEESLRHGDEAAAVGAACGLSELLISRARWNDAWSLARRTVARLRTWEARVAMAERGTALGLAVLELEAVEGLVAGLAAEAAVLGTEAPSWLPLRRAQARFWQGPDEDPAAAMRFELVSDEARVWRSLVDGRMSDAASGLTAGAVLPGVARAIEVEGLAQSGRLDAARSHLKSVPAAASCSPLERALISHLRRAFATACDPGPGGDPLSDGRVLPGLCRWGIGGAVIQDSVLHRVPDLLQVLADAEDDASALAGVCRWIRGHPGISGAGILGPDGERIVMSGLTSTELVRDELRQAEQSAGVKLVAQEGRVLAIGRVRCFSRPAGLVVVAGAAEAAEAATAVAATVAPLCGPALRSRLDAMAIDDARLASMPELLGSSPAVQAVQRAVARAARTAFAVLIDGESGTGKELAARALHRLSPRRDRTFCPVNCAALTDDLVEAELFGHARGAFTGAMAPRPGLFEEAQGGTLFLDEVGELSPRAQAKLLRALQEREVRRVGENTSRRVDVRVVAATNRPLGQAVVAGQFREDLLFRLAVVRITMPPLRDRPEDVAILARAFWIAAAAETGTRARLGSDALGTLGRHAWPGNVRELQNVMSALVLLAPTTGRVGDRLVSQVLAHRTGASGGTDERAGLSLVATRRACEQRRIAVALARHGGRRAPAARELGLSRQGLTKAMARVGLGRRRTRREAGVA